MEPTSTVQVAAELEWEGGGREVREGGGEGGGR